MAKHVIGRLVKALACLGGIALLLAGINFSANAAVASTTVKDTLVFGPNKLSTFAFDGYNAVVVGVKNLTEGCFCDEDYYGARCFVDDRITDAEKEDDNEDDNWWCFQISELNMIYMSGWAKTSGLMSKYPTVDDALEYFCDHPKLIRYATRRGDFTTVVEGTYGFDDEGNSKFFNWFKAVTKQDLTSSTKTGEIDSSFAQTLVSLLGNGDYVMQIAPLFDHPTANTRWSDECVTHGLVCCGYVIDPQVAASNPAALKALFIIDSDNDQNYDHEGGDDAPNSIIYCPVEWDADMGCFVLGNLWGDSPAYLYSGMTYKALKKNPPSAITITFDGNGAEEITGETTKSYEWGETFGDSFPTVSRDATKYVFLGWYTAKKGGTKLTEQTSVPDKSTTVYARWEERKAHALKVVGGFIVNAESGSKVTSRSTYPDETVSVEFDESKITDSKSKQITGEFVSWLVSPATAELGDAFDEDDAKSVINMPNAAVTLTAKYVPLVAGHITVNAEQIGSDDPATFYWSIDGGKTKTPCSKESTPVAAGRWTVGFYAIDNVTGKVSSDWHVPQSQVITVAARGSYRESNITYYYNETTNIVLSARFVADDNTEEIDFDANGGTTTAKELYYLERDGTYDVLPEATRNGYIFDGWWTAKTGGTQIKQGDAVDFTLLNSKETLYAHWIRAYKLTVKTAQTVTSKGFQPQINVNGEAYASALSIVQGNAIAISAPESTVDGNGEEYIFMKWEVSSRAKIDECFDTASCSGSLTMPASDVTLTAKYRPRNVKITVTVGNGTTVDLNGNDATRASLYVGQSYKLTFNDDRIIDRNGNKIGAFQRWTWTPATITADDLGEGFNMFNPETTFTVPEDCSSFAITAQYVSTVAGSVTYYFGEEGSVDEETEFYWSPDNGKTLIPEEVAYPLSAGTVKAKFYAKKESATGADSTAWKAPSAVSLTIPKRTTYKEGGVTHYNEPTNVIEQEWFVAADGAKQIQFNANGGKCATASRWYLDDDVSGYYYTLPVPAARSGYVFNGWWTSKTDGELVGEEDDVDFSKLETRPTLYAHWLKSYKLSLGGTDVTATYGDDTYTKSASVLQGEKVELYAPGEYTDSKGNEYVFQCWTPSRVSDFGDEFEAGKSSTTIEMPAADVTMTATYVKANESAWITMCATAETICLSEGTIAPDTTKFFWSINGKTWFKSGTRIAVKKGSYNIQWKSAIDVWKAPSARTKVTVAVNEDYTNSEEPVEFTFVKAVTVKTCIYSDGDLTESTECGTATTNPTDGKFITGKAMTLTAKAKKGYVFVGWRLSQETDLEEYGLELETTESSWKCYDDTFEDFNLDKDDYKIHLEAVFRAISDYEESDMERLFESHVGGVNVDYTDPLAGKLEIEAMANCCCSIEFYTDFEKCWPMTAKLKNAPSGFKYELDELDYGKIVGTPKKTGTYDFTLLVTDPAGHTATLDITLNVRPFDTSVVGNYRAMMSGYNVEGILEMSIASSGKVSAKIAKSDGTTVSLTPTLYWEANSGDSDSEEDDNDGEFSIDYYKETGDCNAGTETYLYTYDDTIGFSAYSWNGYEGTGSNLSGKLEKIDTSCFSDEEFQANFLGKYYTATLSGLVDDEEAEESESSEDYRAPTELLAPGYLTLTTDKKGNVRIAGKLPDGEKVSASTVLIPDEDGNSATAYLLVTPSSYKKQGYASLAFTFKSSGEVNATGTWITPPLMTAISNHTPDEDEDLFLQGKLSISLSGLIYSSLTDLTDYYMSLGVNLETVPTLEYSYKDGNETVYDEAASHLPSFSIGSDIITGGKNGRITVARSASPWKQSDGTYNYDETKSGDEITNPSGLTISFKPATGIFSGKFNLFFDYETTRLEHKAVSCAYDGVVLRSGDDITGIGSALYSTKKTYQYCQTDAYGNSKAATKTYTFKHALSVTWSFEGFEED